MRNAQQAAFESAASGGWQGMELASFLFVGASNTCGELFDNPFFDRESGACAHILVGGFDQAVDEQHARSGGLGEV